MTSHSRQRTRSLGRWLAFGAATVMFGAAGAASAQSLTTILDDLTGSDGPGADIGGTVFNLVDSLESIATTGKATPTTAASLLAGAPQAINKYTGQIIPNGAVMLVWTGDGCSTPLCDPQTSQDFMAVVDAEPNSTTYGNVIWTAELPHVLVSDVAGNFNGALSSDSHNDPHHMTAYTSYISGGGDGLQAGHKYSFAGGVISKNVFRYDITSVRNLQTADIAVCGTQPRRSSLTDDFLVMPAPGPNHKIMYTYMSNYVYGPGGTVTEIDPGRNAPTALGVCLPSVPAPIPVLQSAEQLGLVGELTAGADVPDNNPLLGHKGITEYPGIVAAHQPRNPKEYTSYPDTRIQRTWNEGVFYFGNKDVGLEALPHGMSLTYDGKYLVQSDYAVAASIGAAAINGALRGLCNQEPLVTGGKSISAGPLGVCGSTFGSSVRVYPTSNSYTYGKTIDSLQKADIYKSNPYIRSVSAVPDGPRHEEVIFHEENEGLMAFGLPHQSHHNVGQKGWVNLGDPSYDKAVSSAGVAANAASTVTTTTYPPGDPNYIPHDGAFAAAMCGGVLFYSPDITLDGNTTNVFGGKGPYWRAIYDVGPCTGVSYFNLTDDDRFLILPISGIESPASVDADGAVEFDRDYPREHSRRVLTLDIRPLLSKGHADTVATAIACDFEPPDASRTANTTLGLAATRADASGGVSGKFNILKHNDEADDCPRVRGAIGQFETGVLGQGLATTESSNTNEPGVGYYRLGQTIQETESGTPQNIFLDAAQVGGEPSGNTGGGPGSGNLNSIQNFYTHGGPHFTVMDRIGYQTTPSGQGGYLNLVPQNDGSGLQGVPADAVEGQPPATGTERFAFIQYFVELNHVPLPGTGSDGDRTVCLGLADRETGATVMDTSFTDELLGTPCLDFDSAARDAWLWPGERGAKGAAKPHAAIFERDGAALFGPGYYPAAPINVGNGLSLPAPSGLIAYETAPGSVYLKWNPSAGATDYYVFYGTASGKEMTKAPAAITPTTVISGLNPAQTYYFFVEAYNHGTQGSSLPSNEASAK